MNNSLFNVEFIYSTTHTLAFYKIREKEKNERGITLIALVLTIIVLIILAGISITMISGQDGILKRAGNAKVQTSLAKAKETANLEYIKLLSEYTTNKGGEPTLEDIKVGLEESGYTVYQIPSEGSSIRGINLNKTNVALGIGESDEINVIFDIDGEMEYYVEVDKQNYKMTLENDSIEIAKNASDIGNKVLLNLTVQTSNSDIVATVSGNKIIVKDKAEKAATGNITVKYGDYSKTCDIAVVSKPNENDTVVADTTFSTDYGKIDVVWLSGTTNTVISTPNTPILTDGANSMIPVVYDETQSKFVTTDTSNANWYRYNGESDGESVTQGNIWANAITVNGSYFVWIPRFAYKITYYESETSKAPTGYYDGYGMWRASDGAKRCELDTGIETVNVGKEKYIVHPAFCSNVDNGGWSNNISGFWCAKYEASQGEESTLQFVPNVASWRNQTIGTQYEVAIQATYGYSISQANSDGIRSFMYSHMMKNSEWGAVAYLAHSRFGRNGKEIDINNSSDYITGNGGGSTSASSQSGTINAYSTVKGVKASTTGNVYGIYDMSGGAWEYVASFNSKDDKGRFSNYGWNTIGNIVGIKGNVDNSTKLTSATSTKYATKYDNKTIVSNGNNIIYTVGKNGDGTKEVNKGGKYNSGDTTYYYNWFDDLPNLVCSTYSFMERGAYYDSGSIAGIFYTSSFTGNYYSSYSFRSVLIP